MGLEGWDQLAAWRDFRMGERGDLWHRAIIDPTLLRVVGPVRGLRLLDLACGNGYLSRRWARQGASRVVGIESSRTSLAFARKRERAHPTGAEFLERDARNLRGLKDGTFDLVVSNMALQDIRDAAGTVREVSRVLGANGRFVFSISHPCFDLDERSAWVVERVRELDGTWHNVVWRKIRAYRDERTVRVPWKMSETMTGWTTAYHRTLASYSGMLRAAGMAITRLEEPAPLPEAVRGSPQGPYMREIPLHIVVEARPFRPPLPGSKVRVSRGSGSRSWGRSYRTRSPRSGSSGRRQGTGSRGRGSRTGS
jgi:ubiquinone/menaquinone biosynthesis C-methylase UbiE